MVNFIVIERNIYKRDPIWCKYSNKRNILKSQPSIIRIYTEPLKQIIPMQTRKMSDSWTPVIRNKRNFKVRCTAVECNSVGRKDIFNGLFCHVHFLQLKEIRKKVKQARLNENMIAELQWRLQEQHIRGVDIGHAYRILVLQEKLNCLPVKRPTFEYFIDNKKLYNSKKTTDDYITHLSSFHLHTSQNLQNSIIVE